MVVVCTKGNKTYTKHTFYYLPFATTRTIYFVGSYCSVLDSEFSRDAQR